MFYNKREENVIETVALRDPSVTYNQQTGELFSVTEPKASASGGS